MAVSPEDFAARLGLSFSDPALLVRALTHPSWVAEHGGEDYERLEFLGDSVLGLIVAERVHAAFPHLQEGELSRMKTSVVRGGSLADAARVLGIQDALRLGKGAERSGDRERTSVLEAAFEALVGAVFLDAGMDAASELASRALGSRLETEALENAIADPKSRLQEITQSRGAGLPSYALVGQAGPPHQRTFTVQVSVAGDAIAEASGPSKQAAEQEAATQALRRLESD